MTTDTVREKALQDYRKKLLEHKEVESRLKESKFASVEIRLECKSCQVILAIETQTKLVILSFSDTLLRFFQCESNSRS